MPGKYYRLLKKEGLGPCASNDGILRETYSLTELEEAGVTEKELVVNRTADCGCLVSGQEIAKCSCGRIVCLKHSVLCGGNIVCLQCCPAQGRPDFFVCLSCGLRRMLKILGRGSSGRHRKEEILHSGDDDGNA